MSKIVRNGETANLLRYADFVRASKKLEESINLLIEILKTK